MTNDEYSSPGLLSNQAHVIILIKDSCARIQTWTPYNQNLIPKGLADEQEKKFRY